MADRLDCPVAVLTKLRPEHNVSRVMHVIGEVEGKTAIIVDDIIDTAGTLVNGVQALMEQGAKAVYAACTHPVLSGPAYERIAAVAAQGGGGHRHHPAARRTSTARRLWYYPRPVSWRTPSGACSPTSR